MGVEKLNPEEIETLTTLLRKVTPLPRMEWPVLKTWWECRLSPMNPQELVILQHIPKNVFTDGYPQVLLTKRPPTDPDFPNAWHHPGGYLGSNEFVREAIERILQKEIKVGLKNYRAVGLVNWPRLARDHEFSGLYVCEPTEPPTLTPGKTQWFDFNNLPEGLLHHHVLMHERVKEHLEFTGLIAMLDEASRGYTWKFPFGTLSERFRRLSTVLESDATK